MSNKTVFSSNSEVIHVFAQRTQKEGRCGNIFFNGNTIYSYGYHYELGKFIENKKGETAILINDKGYSSSTSKHISIITSATRQYKQFFLADICPIYVLGSVKASFKKLAKARKPEMYYNAIINLVERFETYYIFNPSAKKSDDYKKSIREIRKVYRTVSKIANGDGDVLAKMKADANKKALAENKAIKAKAKKAIESFMNYETNWIRLKLDVLRISKDGLNVETSQGVKVSVNDAKKLYIAIIKGVDVKGYKIGHYTVNSVNGTLKIGCHNICINSVKQVGEQLIK